MILSSCSTNSGSQDINPKVIEKDTQIFVDDSHVNLYSRLQNYFGNDIPKVDKKVLDLSLFRKCYWSKLTVQNVLSDGFTHYIVVNVEMIHGQFTKGPNWDISYNNTESNSTTHPFYKIYQKAIDSNNICYYIYFTTDINTDIVSIAYQSTIYDNLSNENSDYYTSNINLLINVPLTSVSHVDDSEKIATKYLNKYGYKIEDYYGKISEHILNKEDLTLQPNVMLWAVQNVDSSKYINKKIETYEFVITNHPLDKLSENESYKKTLIDVMVCEGIAIGGYSVPFRNLFEVGTGIYSIDGKTSEEISD